MQKSIVRFSEVEDRLDSEFYDPEFLEKERILEESQVELLKLSNLSKLITDGSHQTPTYVDQGVTFLSSGNIRELQIDFNNTKCISWDEHERLERTQVTPGDVLVAKSGRIGTAAVAPEDIGDCNLYEGVALVRTNDNLNPYYLAAFLNSPLGKYQILRSKKGVSQPHLHLEEIEEIQIPNLETSKQKEIEKIVKESRESWDDYLNLLSNSKSELENRLGVSNDYKDHTSYQNKYGKLSDRTRLDAEYYQPKYQEILEDIRDNGFELVEIKKSDQIELSNERIDPSDNPSDTIQYITIGDIDSETGEIIDHELLKGHEAPNRAKMLLNEGDVLVPSLRDSEESIALVSEDEDGYIGTNGFYVMRSTNVPPEYTFTLMRSRVVQFQMDQRESGMRLTSVNKSSFKEILIPVTDEDIHEIVTSIINDALEEREKYNRLINESMRRIEKWVKLE